MTCRNMESRSIAELRQISTCVRLHLKEVETHSTQVFNQEFIKPFIVGSSLKILSNHWLFNPD